MTAAETRFDLAGEHPIAASVRLRAMRRVLWMRLLWSAEAADAPPQAITHEEVDRILADPAALAAAEADFYQTDPQPLGLGEALALVELALAAHAGWQRLGERFELTPPECQLLALAAAAGLEPELARVYAYLHDRPDMDYATPWLTAALYGPGVEPVSPQPGGGARRWGLLTAAGEARAEPLSGWVADPALVAWLAQGGTADLPPGAALADARGPDLPVLYGGILQSMLELVAGLEGQAATLEIELAAPPGSGRRTLAWQLAGALGRPLVAVSEAQLLEDLPDAAITPRILAVARAARLRQAVLYWQADGAGRPGALALLRGLGGLLLVGRIGTSRDTDRGGAAFRSYELPPLELAARLAFWGAIAQRPPPPQIREWLLTPAEILAIRRVAEAGPEAIAQACRRPADSAELLVRLPLPYAKGDLALPASVMGQIDELEQQIRYRWEVYEDWGFGRLCPNGRGIVALFAGPSGTGKTMAAQVLARCLGLELYRLDPAQVVNKYIGETEKRLKLVFDECDRANFLLLIDECEGMFGQRFSSKDAHDRYANLEIDYLLQRLERFQGVAVLATNRKNDLDPAFLRRIRSVVDFLPPGPGERARLWRAALGSARLEAIDWDALAERVTLTGAEINLAALNAAFLARAQGERIGMTQVLAGVRRELAKKGQSLRGFE